MLPSSPLIADAHRLRRGQWRVLLASMVCYLFYYTGRQTFGFAIPGIERELGVTKTQLGWISAAMLWSYAIGQVINGNLGDKYGGRVMMSAGSVLSCAFNWLVSFAHSPATLLAAWGLNGFAQSMGWAPGSRVLSNWWGHAQRGRVYGAYVFSAGMSSVLTFAAASLILSLGFDWRWIFRLPVLLLLVGGVIYYVLVRNRPEDEGLQPPPPPPDEEQSPAIDDEGMLDRYRAVLANRQFLLASVAIGFQSIARYGLLIWVPVHLLGADWKEDVYGKWVSLALPLGMAVGALASGWISDRLFHGNRSRPIALMMTLAALAALAMYAFADNLAISVPLLFLCGFFAYGPQSAFWALCPDLLGRRRAGTGVGVMNAFAYACAGLGEPTIGWIIETNDNRTDLVFIVVAASCLLSAALATAVKR